MFSKQIDHPLFSELKRGLFGYSGRLDISSYKSIEISIQGRSDQSLKIAVAELTDLIVNMKNHLNESASVAFEAYEIIKEGGESKEVDLEGRELPEIKNIEEIWEYMVLEEILIAPQEKYIVRMSFCCPWDIEHDFGIYVSNCKYQYSGISV